MFLLEYYIRPVLNNEYYYDRNNKNIMGIKALSAFLPVSIRHGDDGIVKSISFFKSSVLFLLLAPLRKFLVPLLFLP